MSKGKGRRREDPGLPPPLLARCGWGMLLIGILLGLPAAMTGGRSVLMWADVGSCVAISALFFLTAHRQDRSVRAARRRSAGSGRGERWRDTALVLAALITIVSPAVKLLVDLGSRAVRPVAAEGRECRPVAPPGETDPW